MVAPPTLGSWSICSMTNEGCSARYIRSLWKWATTLTLVSPVCSYERGAKAGGQPGVLSLVQVLVGQEQHLVVQAPMPGGNGPVARRG